MYDDQDPTTGIDIFALPVDGDRKPISLVHTRSLDTQGQISPDGRWLAYTSFISGTAEVYVQSFPTASGTRQVSAIGGKQPRWRRDGRELFYVSSGGTLIAVPIAPAGHALQLGAPRELFAFPGFGFDNDYSYAVDASGRRFLINTVVSDTTQPIVVVLNWPAALMR